MDATLLAPLAVTAMMGGVDASVQITLTLPGNVQREIVQYQCEGRDDPVLVDYVNAAPNYLAIVPVENDKLVFVNVISASGARYAAGGYVWWTSGADASLYDEFAGDDPVLTCVEVNEAP